ncbi:hypothetical protein JK177_03555, partial [Gluconobacter sphaericus]|nr:hypothetical protein [Gluconobacter sphaericus]
MTTRPHIAVIGAGAWGTALACATAATGADVWSWLFFRQSFDVDLDIFGVGGT